MLLCTLFAATFDTSRHFCPSLFSIITGFGLMFIPIPRLILIPYWLIRSIYEFLQEKRWSDKYRKIVAWRKNPEDPLRPKDYRIKYVTELRTAIEAEKAVHLKYSGSKGLTYRKVLPERLFRKGEYIYLEALCLKKMDYRKFRLNRIKYLKVD